MEPTKDAALQFAIILSSGMPSIEAILYFAPDLEGAELKGLHDRWMRADNVRKAILTVQGKPWEKMTLEERIRFAIDKNYSEMAYFLYSHNYNDLVGNEKQKADTCRTVLEQKLAGMAGKMDSLMQFFDDIKSGKVKVQKPVIGVAN